MEILPPEIETDILLRLPIKTLCRFKCVCKPWRNQIISPHFSKTHISRSSTANCRRELFLAADPSRGTLHIIDYESPALSQRMDIAFLTENPENLGSMMGLVGSSNGLVCLYFRPNTLALFNPATKEFLVLPDPGPFPSEARTAYTGFGYVRSADDFMVVKIATNFDAFGESVVRLYSAKANCWKTVESYVPFRIFPWVKSVYVNGAVHWLGFCGISGSSLSIMGFDFEKEKFMILPLPEKVNQYNVTFLGDAGGYLSIFSRDFEHPNLDMWVMSEYGVVKSWSKNLTVPNAYDTNKFLFPVSFVRNQLLVLVDYRKLVLYDQVDKRFTEFDADIGNSFEVTIYEESLVSPCGYIGQDEDREDNSGKRMKGGVNQQSRLM